MSHVHFNFNYVQNASLYQSPSATAGKKTSPEITFKANIEWHFGDDGSVGVWLSYRTRSKQIGNSSHESKCENIRLLDRIRSVHIQFHGNLYLLLQQNGIGQKSGSNISVLCHDVVLPFCKMPLMVLIPADTHTHTYTLWHMYRWTCDIKQLADPVFWAHIPTLAHTPTHTHTRTHSEDDYRKKGLSLTGNIFFSSYWRGIIFFVFEVSSIPIEPRKRNREDECVKERLFKSKETCRNIIHAWIVNYPWDGCAL